MKDFTLDQKIIHYLEGVVVKTSKVLIYWYDLIEKISYASKYFHWFQILS